MERGWRWGWGAGSGVRARPGRGGLAASWACSRSHQAIRGCAAARAALARWHAACAAGNQDARRAWAEPPTWRALYCICLLGALHRQLPSVQIWNRQRRAVASTKPRACSHAGNRGPLVVCETKGRLAVRALAGMCTHRTPANCQLTLSHGDAVALRRALAAGCRDAEGAEAVHAESGSQGTQAWRGDACAVAPGRERQQIPSMEGSERLRRRLAAGGGR